MELEFPEFVLLLLVAVGLAVFGPSLHGTRDRLDRMATIPAAAACAAAVPDESSHFFGAPAPPRACTVH